MKKKKKTSNDNTRWQRVKRFRLQLIDLWTWKKHLSTCFFFFTETKLTKFTQEYEQNDDCVSSVQSWYKEHSRKEKKSALALERCCSNCCSNCCFCRRDTACLHSKNQTENINNIKVKRIAFCQRIKAHTQDLLIQSLMCCCCFQSYSIGRHFAILKSGTFSKQTVLFNLTVAQ